MEQKVESFETQPKFYELLSKNDKILYNNMRSGLSSHACRNRRGKRLETFSEMLNAIKTYCVRNDEDDWKRCLVCGVCWLPNGIAINTRHLSLLIDKCKSSINGSLQKMGYSTLQSRSESGNQLSDTIPLLKNNFNELREWTIRQFVATTPNPQIQMGAQPSQKQVQMSMPSPQPQNMMNYAMTPSPRLPIPVMQQYYMPSAVSIPNMQKPPCGNYPIPVGPMTPMPMIPNSMSQPQMQTQQQQPLLTETPDNSLMPDQANDGDMPDFNADPMSPMPAPNGYGDFDENDPLALTPSFIYDGMDDYDQLN